jgi:hypothetical protein
LWVQEARRKKKQYVDLVRAVEKEDSSGTTKKERRKGIYYIFSSVEDETLHRRGKR